MPNRIETRMAFVSVRDNGWRCGPLQSEFRIVVSNAAFVFGRIEFVNEVKRLRVIDKRDKSVRESLWNVHHPTIISGQFSTVAFSESRRTFSQIKDHIIQRATE